MIRGAFVRACEYNKNKRGKDLTSLIADKLIEDPINTLKAMAAFNPRQMSMDITHKVEVADIIALAQQRQAQLRDITPKTSELQENCVQEHKPLIGKAIEEGSKPSSAIIVTVEGTGSPSTPLPHSGTL